MTTFNPTAADFHNAKILDLGDDFTAIAYPAFHYLHAKNSEEKPVCADKGAMHLGEQVPGVAVPFKTRNHGMLHKHFGIGFYKGGDGGEAGQPFAYGKGATITAEKRAAEFLAAANIGETILLNGKRYHIRKTANENIELDPVA